ncbi:hypothetical protein DWB58_25145 [candidate division KSB1 bacterium]|nr:hypothetical protein [candidate division KSB1 bacterium]MCE7941601.1 hypothetical protein [Chlorobi bacterium CHB1]
MKVKKDESAMKKLVFPLLITLFVIKASAQEKDSNNANRLVQIEAALKSEVPRVLCLNENIATGGQPKSAAFAKLASNGYRSVLTLRTDKENVDLKKDRELTEAAGMRYIQIPVVTAAPDPKHVEEFIKTVQDKKNYPMLIYCGSANRVAAFWMIYRVVAEGWAEEKAMEEAVKIGLTRPELKAFVQSYLASNKQK